MFEGDLAPTMFGESRHLLFPSRRDRDEYLAHSPASAAAELDESFLVPIRTSEMGECGVQLAHEPAIPVCTLLDNRSGPRPDALTLLWVAWSAVRALNRLKPGQVHGTISPASILLDARRRIRIADFGLARALAPGGDSAAARRLHYAIADTGVGSTAVWTVMPPGTIHEGGWLAPFWAPELLSGRFFPTARSDQFSLGVVLYLLATGVHPYSTEFCDPDLPCHWVLEPADLGEKRPDWSPAFHRAANGLSIRDDSIVLTLSSVFSRMLSWDSSQRFPSLGEILTSLRPIVPTAWETALHENSRLCLLYTSRCV